MAAMATTTTKKWQSILPDFMHKSNCRHTNWSSMVYNWSSVVYNWSSMVCVDLWHGWDNMLLSDDGMSVNSWCTLRYDGIESVDWIGGVVDLSEKKISIE